MRRNRNNIFRPHLTATCLKKYADSSIFQHVAPPSGICKRRVGSARRRHIQTDTQPKQAPVTYALKIPDVFCRDIELFDIFFGKFTISIPCFIEVLRDAKGRVFIGLGCLLLLATDIVGLRDAVGPAWAFGAWIFFASVYVAMVMAVLGLLSVFQHFLPRFPYYAFISTSFCVLLVFGIMRISVLAMTDGNHVLSFFPYYWKLVVAACVVETIFIRFVLPEHKSTPAAPPPQDDQNRTLKIRDKQFTISNVLHMNAQEHYIQITTITERTKTRSRLSDAVAQTTPQQGVQPHRSWWVSAKSEPALTTVDAKPVLKLNDGTIVPVAKARQDEVKKWLSILSEGGRYGQ